MFYECNQLTTLDLSSFNTRSAQTLQNMFYNCNSLNSLTLGDFNNVNVNNMNSMFFGCNSIISLDLHDFNIPSITDVNDMFKNCNENLIYCLKIENREQILNKLVNQLSPSNENCSLICIEYLNSKYIFDENRCVNSCFDEVSYKFEYNNICLLSCPERTHNPPGQPYLCQNDILACDIKCSNCTFESEDIGLCITCNTNENYFPKINDPSNINGFINCYSDIEGYFIDFRERIF